MFCPSRIAAVALGLFFSASFAACAHTASNDDSSSAGSAGSVGSAGSAGSAEMDAGDSGTDADADVGVVEQVDASTSCSDLYTLARTELDQAAACDLSASSGQCEGLVDVTCGCPVSVDSQTSTATESYLNTLAVIQQKNCVQNCPAEFCQPAGPGMCVPQTGSTNGVCIHQTITP
ncbi:MAG TPA: hypothetical protein VHV51_16520 [Polyangiaceae bacterium]|jgi:hypothetical protein|nr:hypothetical protein [Polyangiaceae bacterium]